MRRPAATANSRDHGGLESVSFGRARAAKHSAPRTCLGIALTAVLLSPAPLAADTLLLGFDSALMSPNCFIAGRNITARVWKAFRWTASASGTISYFKFRLIEPTDSRDDNFVWAVYADNGGSVGELMAYGAFMSYDWTAAGVGEHRFGVTNTVTTATIAGGTSYWLVCYSRDMDGSTYTSSTVIPTQRGEGSCAPGIVIRATDQNRWTAPNAPPPPSYYTYQLMSYHAWSLWAEDPVSAPPASPLRLRAVP